MNKNNNWELIERKMLELRILTNANWKNREYELAALGERVLRSVERAKEQSESLFSNNDLKTIEVLEDEIRFTTICEMKYQETLKDGAI
jgi:hypothetical protein